MTLATLAVILAGIIIVAFIWDVLDPDALVMKYNSPGRAVLSLCSITFTLWFAFEALVLSTLAIVVIVLAILLLATWQAFLKDA